MMKFNAIIYVMAVICLNFININADGVELTRSQWLKKIGASVLDENVLAETFSQVPDSDKVEFVQRVMKAVSRMPVEPETRAANFVNAAVACIQGSKGDVRYSVIAEVFATVPVPFLPIVTEELSKRFNQEFNKLSDGEYEKIATAVIEIASKRNALTDDPAVRDTFVLLAFLRGTDMALDEKLIGLLADDRTKGLVAGWLPEALKGNYETLLAAADVEMLQLDMTEYLKEIGHSKMQSYLFLLNFSVDEVARGVNPLNNVWLTSPTQFDPPIDFGISTLPKGYQNQSISVGP